MIYEVKELKSKVESTFTNAHDFILFLVELQNDGKEFLITYVGDK